MYNNLSEISTVDLQCELAVRTFQSNHGAIPRSFLALIAKIATVLGTHQRHQLSLAMHECANELNQIDFVHADFAERFSPTNIAKRALADADENNTDADTIQ